MKVSIETIPHGSQRYPTTGDWQISNDPVTGEPVILVRVSSMAVPDEPHNRAKSWPMEALVAVHELVEAVLALRSGIDQASVDEFDILFEKFRLNRILRQRVLDRPSDYPEAHLTMCEDLERDEDAEPGDCYACPVYTQHQIATAVERMMASQMALPWNDYEEANLQLYSSDDNPPANLP